MKKRSLFFLFLILFFLFCSSPVCAVSVSIANVPSALSKDQEMSVDVSVAGASANTTNYLRAAFYPDGSSTSYSGFTFNGSDWYNGSPSPIDPKKFLPIQVDSGGSWSGQLKAKLDTDDSSFTGSGTYFFKIARYTESASSISNWSDPVQITVVAPSPTPTQKDDPTPTKTSATATPLITTISSPIPTDAPEEREGGTDSAEVLSETNDQGISNTLNDSVTPQPTAKVEVLSESTNGADGIFIGLGILVLACACGILGFRWWKKKARIRNQEL